MAAKALSPIDPTSFSRPDICVVRKMHFELDVDFNTRTLSGDVYLEIAKVDINAKELILDTNNLHIHKVEDLIGQPLKYEKSREVIPFGSKLTITLPSTTAPSLTLRIFYETSINASGLHWLEPEQTLNKTYPFLFSQFNTIHARSVIPCQDTPFAKVEYIAQITVPTNLTVVMGAKEGKSEKVDDRRTKHTFEQKIPVSPYKIGIAVAKLESRKIGERSYLWAEPELIEAAAYEFAETELMLKTAEEFCGSYQWDIFGILVLPPSFPYGAMDISCCTFVTPTIIVCNHAAGDRSLISMIAHEICCNWYGSLVTAVNFEHMWLNESFAMFVERKIMGRMYGPQVSEFEALIGFTVLQDYLNMLGMNNPNTKIVSDITGICPDDLINPVIFEKGFIFMRHLEELVGGPKIFEPFLKEYINTFKYKSLTSEEFKHFFLSKFKDNKVKNINWKTWFSTVGMPPQKIKYDKSLANACIKLSNKWIEWNSKSTAAPFTENDVKIMNPLQIIYFLQLILTSDAQPIWKLERMDQIYGFSNYKNSEIKMRWIRIGLKAHWQLSIPRAIKTVTECGRYKIIRPLYQDMYNWEEARPQAIETFLANKKSMMYSNSSILKQILHIEV